jgi:hypothetical protein
VPSSGGLILTIEGVASCVIPAIPVHAAFSKLQLRGADIGGGPMPIAFLGFSVPA